jgi:hypothetical protein
VLALLYFWADMSRSPFAARELPGTALGLALLFLWMKFWQTIFVANLRARISAEPPIRWTPGRCWRVFIIQTAIQPSSVVLLPLALLPAALPFGWVYAFYQNVTALTDGETGEVRQVFKRAWKQSLLWPMQNHFILAILLGFAAFIFLNLMSVCYLLPQLLKMLLGIDSVYTQSPASMFNTTFFAALVGLTYLCVDPIIKTVYLLRCFYGESLQSGEDLKAELKQFASLAGTAAATMMLALILICANSISAADATQSNAPATKPSAIPAKASMAAVSPPALDKAINQVIHQPKYTWRMPREKIVADDTTDGPVMRFLRSVMDWTKRTLKDFFHWLGDLIDKWFRGRRTTGGSLSGFDFMRSLQSLLIVLIVVLACAVGILIFRARQRNRRRTELVSSEAIPALPDLADENVGADQLPEDGWIKLGRELLGRGELRLALRAFYFASLAHLAARNLITIARFKSNRDYERELGRRGHAIPDVLSLFGENVAVFDRSWYGLHEVNPDLVSQFLANVERIKAVG